jgi:hypothetical protein
LSRKRDYQIKSPGKQQTRKVEVKSGDVGDFGDVPMFNPFTRIMFMKETGG